jgi:hypothetical protein
MVCKCKPCKAKKSDEIENTGKKIKLLDYPSPDEEGFGHGKFCYFISCPGSKLPIRDYVYEGKPEPHYENKSYNECASCNQKGIKNAYDRGISYVIFYTRYRGKKENYRNRYFITGLFPISAQRDVCTRKAYMSNNPIFLSIGDSIELNDKVWQKWFKTNLPKDYRGTHNLHFMAKFVKKDSPALADILNHFKKMKNKNKIDEYINEIRIYETEENR